jgi:DNA-directed RNA polymerase subunit RPC12/RpoP
VVAVRCEHCGFTYDTDLPVRAVERIRRCSRCGHSSLVAVPAGEDDPAERGTAAHEERREA